MLPIAPLHVLAIAEPTLASIIQSYIPHTQLARLWPNGQLGKDF